MNEVLGLIVENNPLNIGESKVDVKHRHGESEVEFLANALAGALSKETGISKNDWNVMIGFLITVGSHSQDAGMAVVEAMRKEDEL